jgi:RING finger/CHY zinc finger protein 1
VKNEGEKDPKKRHTLDRHKVVSVRCRTCATVQPPQQKCTCCGTVMGAYFCGVCNLFDDEGAKKQIFHCDGCGICRVGGRDTFFHCDKCQACFAIALKGSHRCIEGNLKQDCPVCLEDMHTSRSAATLLKCGHAMHGSCLTDCLKGGNYRCPLCSSSIVDMSRYWRETDVECALTLMPAEYASTWVRVLCNDCHGEADTPWHIGGLKCRSVDPEKRKARLARAAAMRAGSGAAAAAAGAGDAPPAAPASDAAAAGAAAGATEASGSASAPATAGRDGVAGEPPAAADAAAAVVAAADAAVAGAAPAAAIEPVWEDWCGSYNTRKVGTASSAEHEGPAAAAFEAAWREAVLQSAASRMNPALAALLAAGAGGAGGDGEEEHEEDDGLAGEGQDDTDDDEEEEEETDSENGSGHEDGDDDSEGGAASGAGAEGRGSRAAAEREDAGGRGMDVDGHVAVAPAAAAAGATAAPQAAAMQVREAEGRHRAATADTADSMVSARGEEGSE